LGSDLGYIPRTFRSKFAIGRLDQLEGLAADLVCRSPVVIVASGAAAARGAKAATAAILIVLVSGYDPACQGRGASGAAHQPGAMADYQLLTNGF
jgi:hypothetical protein